MLFAVANIHIQSKLKVPDVIIYLLIKYFTGKEFTNITYILRKLLTLLEKLIYAF